MYILRFTILRLYIKVCHANLQIFCCVYLVQEELSQNRLVLQFLIGRYHIIYYIQQKNSKVACQNAVRVNSIKMYTKWKI